MSLFCRSDASFSRRSAPSYEDASFPHNSLQQEPLVGPSSNHINDHHMEDDNFRDDDFDDLPLDELNSVVFQENQGVAEQRSDGVSGVNTGSNWSKSTTQKRDHQGCAKAAPQRSTNLGVITNDESDLMDQDMVCLFEEEEEKMPTRTCSSVVLQGSSSGGEGASSSNSRSSASTLTLASPPFTYLHLLEKATSQPGFVSAEFRLKAFIMTLLGKLSSSGGSWSMAATISDGTGYLDVELSDDVLTGLLGFSVAEKEALKRQPDRKAELSAGMRRCQEELVDMCCVMTVLVKGCGGGKAVVTRAEPVSERMLRELERRVKR